MVETSSPYEDAVQALYRGPRESFVADRKRLASELKKRGEREAAARLSKLARPTLSAWVVNQLYWRERALFDALGEQAARLRAGDVRAANGHREAMLKLRTAAAALLREASSAPNDLTLRRITINLAALAAAGGFAPDVAGALASDRDPPGFESMEVSLGPASLATTTQAQAPTHAPPPSLAPAHEPAQRTAAAKPPHDSEKAASNVHALADAVRARELRVKGREAEVAAGEASVRSSGDRHAQQYETEAQRPHPHAERKRRAQQEAERQRRAQEAERQRRAQEEAERKRRALELERAQVERVELQRERLRSAERRKSAVRAVQARTEELARRRAELERAEADLADAQARLTELAAETARIEQRLLELERTLRAR